MYIYGIKAQSKTQSVGLGKGMGIYVTIRIVGILHEVVEDVEMVEELDATSHPGDKPDDEAIGAQRSGNGYG